LIKANALPLSQTASDDDDDDDNFTRAQKLTGIASSAAR